MRLITISSSCVFLAFSYSSLLNASPRIRCEKAQFDFGTRDSLEVVNHTFVLENSGASDLVITAIRPACGCTASELSRTTIPPGESAELSARLTLAGRSGDIHKTILVESNDPTNSALQLAMQGKIVNEFDVVPSMLVIRKAPDIRAASASTLVRSKSAQPLKVLRVDSDLEFIKARADELPGENAFLVSAILQDDPSPGTYEGKITIVTNSSKSRELIIKTVAIVTGRATIAPSKFTLQKGESPISRSVIMKFPDSQKLEIQKVELPGSDMTYETLPLGDFGIRVQITGIIPKPELDRKHIIFHLSDGQKISLSIHIQNGEN